MRLKMDKGIGELCIKTGGNRGKASKIIDILLEEFESSYRRMFSFQEALGILEREIELDRGDYTVKKYLGSEIFEGKGTIRRDSLLAKAFLLGNAYGGDLNNQLIRHIQKAIGDRDWEIYNKYVVGQEDNLRGLGHKYGVSGERIRQIISKVDRYMPKDNAINMIINYIHTILKGHIIKVSEVYTKLALEKGIKEELGRALLLVTIRSTGTRIRGKGSVYDFYINEGYVIDKSVDESVIESIDILIKEAEYEGFMCKIDIILDHLGLSSLNQLLVIIEKTYRTLVYNNFILIKRNKLVDADRVRLIIMSKGRGMHHTEIHKEYLKMMGIAYKNPCGLLYTIEVGERQGIVRISNGTYGLQELGHSQVGYIKDAVMEVMNSYDRPLLVEEIKELVEDILKTQVRIQTIRAYLFDKSRYTSVGCRRYVRKGLENDPKIIRIMEDIKIHEYRYIIE